MLVGVLRPGGIRGACGCVGGRPCVCVSQGMNTDGEGLEASVEEGLNEWDPFPDLGEKGAYMHLGQMRGSSGVCEEDEMMGRMVIRQRKLEETEGVTLRNNK